MEEKTEKVNGEALQIIEAFEILPKLVVFDLDYTLWPFYCECRSKHEMRSLCPHTKGILLALKEKGIDVPIASRSPTANLTTVFLNKLGLSSLFVAQVVYIFDYFCTKRFLDDYRPVEGIMIAHSGRSVVTLFRFGETAMSHTKTRMEEAWTIEEVAFNVPGLSLDCFIPPSELRFASMSEACELPQGQRVKIAVAAAAYHAKVAQLQKSHEGNTNNINWTVDV